jgi:transcription elongation factor Elf1
VEGESILILFAVLFVLWILGQVFKENNKSKNLERINELEPKLVKLENEIKELTSELSKWIYGCKKCQNNNYYITSISNDYAVAQCNQCFKTYELKYNNAFYKIEVIKDLNVKWNELGALLNNSELKIRLNRYFQHVYIFKGDVAPTWDDDYVVYNYFFNNRKVKYFSFKYWASKKSFILYTNIFYAFFFVSDGSMLDEIEKKKSQLKMGKLNPNRPALQKEITESWNYKSITRGKKSNIIKNWAKKTNQKCPDGRKCGGVYFNSLDFRDIAYGHILSQDFAKTFPHHYEQVHHPDNLYLTCKSCNSSLGGNNADKDLIDRIKNESGTIGDWIRNYINEIESIN